MQLDKLIKDIPKLERMYLCQGDFQKQGLLLRFIICRPGWGKHFLSGYVQHGFALDEDRSEKIGG